ncbi:anhydro-N-acetylmuramic acid kinase [Sphingoaurantiacus capsulatus]|uniref:Anhydro-N-acetylmuramic acid kinase n=1 Tax=Sphingoaurantiacus capsulatus TaxID=1771310 RepID=A0ABV7XGE8_9SPHN
MGSGLRLAVGLMSGTSMDGVDAALIETDGETIVRPIEHHSQPYDEAMRAKLRRAMELALAMDAPAAHKEIDRIALDLTVAHDEAVEALLEKAGVAPDDVDVIGFHGQTVAHRPDRRWTWQIGDGALLSKLSGVTVVDDFRSADVAAGGQGAPLVPVFHRALVEPLREVPGLGCRQAVAVLNLGGVGNITWFGSRDDDMIAFDTGPGNALIDDWVREQGGLTHDEGGALALSGKVDEARLAAMCELPWFAAPPPKSLDRNDFSIAGVKGLCLADGAATLAAFTAESVRIGLGHVPEPTARLLVAGGGRHNAALMTMLRQRLNMPVDPVEAVGWDGDMLEAQAFAYLAVRVLDGKPTSFPTTTGVPQPIGGGRVHRS